MDTPRKVVVLGSTGSIGRQALDVVRSNPDLHVVGLAAGSDRRQLERQADEFGAEHVGLGPDEAAVLAAVDEADVVLNGIVGAAGLRASVAALEAGKTLALANKESLVAAGEVCRRAAARGGGAIVPVDSEHAAIAHCLDGAPRVAVEGIVLTASGGPFRNRADLASVTPHEALQHPNWAMGPKITIDCATLMNKGLEMIEAHHLFALDYDRIEVVVHPQSIVHGGVRFADGSMLLQAAPPDMRIPIQAALTGTHAVPSGQRVELASLGSLDFEPPDVERFPALALASEAGRLGGPFPAALNAANEVAVAAFLQGGIGFTDIPAVVATVLDTQDAADVLELEDVLEVDAHARRRAGEVVGRGIAVGGGAA